MNGMGERNEKRFQIINNKIVDTKTNDVFSSRLVSTNILNMLDDAIRGLEKEIMDLKHELYESERQYIIDTYHDNSVRRDAHLEGLKEEFEERFGEGWDKI